MAGTSPAMTIVEYVGWVERSETHRLSPSEAIDGYRCAPPILRAAASIPASRIISAFRKFLLTPPPTYRYIIPIRSTQRGVGHRHNEGRVAVDADVCA